MLAIETIRTEIARRRFPYCLDGDTGQRCIPRVETVALQYGRIAKKFYSKRQCRDIAGMMIVTAEANRTISAGRSLQKVQNAFRNEFQPAIRAAYRATASSELAQERAIKHAETQAGRLIHDLSISDESSIRAVVSGGIKGGKTASQIADDIFSWVQDDQMTPARALMIAETETATALSAGALAGAMDAGYTMKRWITLHDERLCRACIECEHAGKIPIWSEFPGGLMATPRHPRCRCVVWYGER